MYIYIYIYIYIINIYIYISIKKYYSYISRIYEIYMTFVDLRLIVVILIANQPTLFQTD